MAKEANDKITPDLFQSERRPGRPRSNPLTREEQMRLNKRRQLRRDKEKGLRRVELKLEAAMYEELNRQAETLGLSRSALIETLLKQALANK
ncbi:Ribbon-helix-helix protein, copG family [Idiomarina sp. A28L]|uniref:LexA regulated protein n=1 Tax=Idiomarina sp. A28L TaxID=1036674 RepID=UPI0002138ACC|nr:LexA regulated protein [Idiomarina sp. A28L]EGN75067.1 Ribbon-helix-helix protein, copG family [Idiomarina sp. A28L]